MTVRARHAYAAASLLTLAVAGLGSAAQAEDAAPAAPQSATPADAGDPEGRIVVTARRREEEVQKVPLALSVVDAKTITNTGTFNVNKLTQIQPTLQFYSTNPRNSAATIRGLGAPFGLTNDGIEQGVGIYVDQVYYSRIAAATFDFVDIDRIEVLRGPQGTLYGKNTTAGAINIVTRQPSFTPELRGEVSVGNIGFTQFKSSASAPLSDRVAIRVSESFTHRNGTIYNVTSGQDVNSQDNLGFRGQLLFKATDDFKITVSGDWNRQDPRCCAQIYARYGATQKATNRQFPALAAAFHYAPPSTDAFDRLTDLDTPLRAKQTLGGAAVLAEWNVGPGTLTSVTAWRFWNWDPSNDRDFTGLPITTISQNPSKQKQYTQELRYAGTSGKIDYVGGLFAFYQTIHTTGSQVQGSAASRWLLNPTSANANNPSVLNGLTATNDIRFKNTSLAAFGQVTWHLSDALRIQPGLRVNYDKKSGDYNSVVTTGTGSTTLNSDQRGVLAPQSYSPSFSDWNVSGDITLSYDIAQNVLGYATYARGFKSGGINLSGLPLDAANNPIQSAATVKPEKVVNYEVGLKTTLFDRKVTFNLAGFWTEIRDYQATVTNGQLGVLRGYLANAGKVRVRGIELDTSAHPFDGLNLYWRGAFTDAKYVKFVDAPCPPELSGGTNSPQNCNISGQWLPGISRYAFSYGAEYALPGHLLDFDGHFYAGVDGNYRSKFSSNASRSIYTDINGYALTNFRIGFRTDKTWDLSGWVRNAFDHNYYELLALQSGNTGLVVGQPGDPRTYGATFRFNF